MADKIESCVVTKDDAEVVVQYDVSYSVENVDASKMNSFCVVVKADEMDDPDDTVEAKAKANVKAKVIKDAWIASLVEMTNENVESVVGDVTLE